MLKKAIIIIIIISLSFLLVSHVCRQFHLGANRNREPSPAQPSPVPRWASDRARSRTVERTRNGSESCECTRVWIIDSMSSSSFNFCFSDDALKISKRWLRLSVFSSWANVNCRIWEVTHRSPSWHPRTWTFFFSPAAQCLSLSLSLSSINLFLN